MFKFTVTLHTLLVILNVHILRPLYNIILLILFIKVIIVVLFLFTFYAYNLQSRLVFSSLTASYNTIITVLFPKLFVGKYFENWKYQKIISRSSNFF